ncbi:cytochrome-c peroxidase [Tautonia marina]|uniref:cytochrome-c peroxidase n=1 Tax=Tautonia marina TaxID=2653855 RepID=UPI001F264F57|nr:cytochrome c peroxidase [Tautonia marina]
MPAVATDRPDPSRGSRPLIFVLAILALPAILPGQARSQARPDRPPPRAMEDPEARRARIAMLRDIYAGPPSDWPAPLVDEGVEWVELGLLPEPPHPPENPYSDAKAELGKMLFFDPRLSGSGQIACASCHDPDLGWADGRTTSFGHNRALLKRNAPTVQNTAFFPFLFWDGRAGSLEEQAEAVLRNPQEMHSDEAIIARLVEIPEYQAAFADAFDSEGITLERAAQAIATYERTLVGGRSRFDAFLKGNREALSDAAISGLDLFRREARCLNCHHGPNLSDGRFHDLGLSYYGRLFEDLGRYRVTEAPEDVGRFRTPSLRNIASTSPYMHNGLFELDGVLRMYDAGMATLRPREDQKDDPLFPTKSPLLKPLGLNAQDRDDLRAFLESLTEPKTRVRPPTLPGLHDHSPAS